MIQLKDVVVTFNAGTVNEVQALRNLSFTMPDGELVTVVGSNGAGKSTMLNTVAGVVIPQRGRVTVGDLDVTRMPEHRRASYVGRVFQNPLDGTAAGWVNELLKGGEAALAQQPERGTGGVVVPTPVAPQVLPGGLVNPRGAPQRTVPLAPSKAALRGVFEVLV